MVVQDANWWSRCPKNHPPSEAGAVSPTTVLRLWIDMSIPTLRTVRTIRRYFAFPNCRAYRHVSHFLSSLFAWLLLLADYLVISYPKRGCSSHVLGSYLYLENGRGPYYMFPPSQTDPRLQPLSPKEAILMNGPHLQYLQGCLAKPWYV